VDGDGEEDSGEGVYETGRRDKERDWDSLSLSLVFFLFIFSFVLFPFPYGLTGWAWGVCSSTAKGPCSLGCLFLGKLQGNIVLDTSQKNKARSFPFAFTGLFSVGVWGWRRGAISPR
jgi:hypothetical protein